MPGEAVGFHLRVPSVPDPPLPSLSVQSPTLVSLFGRMCFLAGRTSIRKCGKVLLLILDLITRWNYLLHKMFGLHVRLEADHSWNPGDTIGSRLTTVLRRPRRVLISQINDTRTGLRMNCWCT